MAIRDTKNGYSSISIALHWITAITVITLYLLAELSEDLPKDQRSQMMGLHISIAMSLYVVLWSRIIWRLANKRPVLPPQHPLLDKLAFWVPLVMLAGIAIQLVSGPLIIWSNGNTINIFGGFSLTSPMEKSHSVHEFWEEAHELGANIILAGFALHILGLLKHQFIDRDNLLRKIIKSGNI